MQFLITAKACYLSAYYAIWLKRKSFEKLKSLHQLDVEVENVTYDDDEKTRIAKLALAIKKVEKYAPWKPECYNLALVSKKLLDTYEIPCNINIGFRKRNNKLEGHAWVNCKNMVVSGLTSDLQTYNVLKRINK